VRNIERRVVLGVTAGETVEGMQTPGQKWRTDRPRREIRRPALGKPVGSAVQWDGTEPSGELELAALVHSVRLQPGTQAGSNPARPDNDSDHRAEMKEVRVQEQ
jgi:hypothetical protein